jgi:hypothetical protein
MRGCTGAVIAIEQALVDQYQTRQYFVTNDFLAQIAQVSTAQARTAF